MRNCYPTCKMVVLFLYHQPPSPPQRWSSLKPRSCWRWASSPTSAPSWTHWWSRQAEVSLRSVMFFSWSWWTWARTPSTKAPRRLWHRWGEEPGAYVTVIIHILTHSPRLLRTFKLQRCKFKKCSTPLLSCVIWVIPLAVSSPNTHWWRLVWFSSVSLSFL